MEKRVRQKSANFFAAKVKNIYKKRGAVGLLDGVWWRIKNTPRSFIRTLHPKVLYYKLVAKNGLIIKDTVGGKMFLDVNDLGLSRYLMLDKIREKGATMQIMKELKEGMNVLEVGANKGYYVLIESKKIGDGKIYAFEPDIRNFKVLKKTVEFNKLQNQVSLFNCAVGNENKKVDIYLSNHHNWSNLVRPPWQNKNFGIRKVDLVRTEDFLKGKKIDYVRMDTEGYELEILKGMGNLLKNVKGMFIEYHPHVLKERGEYKEFFDLLKKYDFEIVARPETDHLFLRKKKK
jgi:FkbM family methyltransferase